MKYRRDVIDEDALSLGKTALKAALDKGATDPVAMLVSGLSDYADIVMVVSARSDRQVRAVAESVKSELAGLGRRPLGVEGMSTGLWVLLDYGSLVVHVFHEPERLLYDLEGLWIDAPRLDLLEE